MEKYDFAATSWIYDSNPVYQKQDLFILTSRKDIISVDDLDRHFDDCRYVFLSRHRSESRIPSLTAHFTGNFGENKFGGKAGEVARYDPSFLKNYMLALNSIQENIPEEYEVTLEATHHGPTSLSHSVLFVELGSSHEQWQDKRAAACIADAVIASAGSKVSHKKCMLGVGGTHYPRKFNNFILGSDFALGPIIPKYSLEFLNLDILSQILSKGDQKITGALVDPKGLGPHKKKIINLLRTAGLEVIWA